MNLSNANIFDADLSKHIQRLTKLERLGLRGTHITDAGLYFLRNLTNLHYLDLESCKISDSGMVHLQNLKTLKFLHIPDTNVSDAAINKLQEALPNCRIRTDETRGTRQIRIETFAVSLFFNKVSSRLLEGRISFAFL